MSLAKSLSYKLQCAIKLVFFSVEVVKCNRYAEQLYEGLLFSYDKNVRPIINATGAVEVDFGASLIRILDVVQLFWFCFINDQKSDGDSACFWALELRFESDIFLDMEGRH